MSFTNERNIVFNLFVIEGVFPTLPFPDLRPNHGNPRPEPEHHKRSVTRDINIDVTAIIDFAVYVRYDILCIV